MLSGGAPDRTPMQRQGAPTRPVTLSQVFALTLETDPNAGVGGPPDPIKRNMTCMFSVHPRLKYFLYFIVRKTPSRWQQQRQLPRQHPVRVTQFVYDGEMIGPRHRDQRPRQMRRRPQRMQVPAV
jgi:hypothetical protein